MLTYLFILFIVLGLGYLMWSPRKEVVSLVLLHAFVQYAVTIAFWLFQINTHFTAMLLGFIVSTSLLLLWARTLDYSREWKSVGVFVTLAQWTAVGFVLVLMLLGSPYEQFVPAAAWSGQVGMAHQAIHPSIKLCANLILFTSFFQLIRNWGQRWSLNKSLLELGPLLIYFLILSLLKVFQPFTENSPYI